MVSSFSVMRYITHYRLKTFSHTTPLSKPHWGWLSE